MAIFITNLTLRAADPVAFNTKRVAASAGGLVHAIESRIGFGVPTAD